MASSRGPSSRVRPGAVGPAAGGRWRDCSGRRRGSRPRLTVLLNGRPPLGDGFVERAQGAGTHVVLPAPNPQKVEQPHWLEDPGAVATATRCSNSSSWSSLPLVNRRSSNVLARSRAAAPRAAHLPAGIRGRPRACTASRRAEQACRRVPLPQEFRTGHGDGRVHALGLAQVLLDVLVDRHGGVQRGRVAEALPPREEGLRLVHEQGDPVRRRRRGGRHQRLSRVNGRRGRAGEPDPASGSARPARCLDR